MVELIPQTWGCKCQLHSPGLAEDKDSVYRQLQRVQTRTELWPSLNCHFMLKHWSWQRDQAAPTVRPLHRQRFTAGFPAARVKARRKPCAHRAAPSCEMLPGEDRNLWSNTRARSFLTRPASQLLVSIWTALPSDSPDVLPYFPDTPAHPAPDGLFSPVALCRSQLKV